MDNAKVKVALLSVTDKTGLIDFAGQLHSLGVKLIATGGTFSKISDAGIPVKKIEDITRFPEILDGRVKTLHPKIHAGILADRGKKEHVQTLKENKIMPIDLVVVNLYAFRETIAKEGISLGDAIENIDIGGPALLRAAAKNHESVAVVTMPFQYDSIIEELKKNNCCLSLSTRKKLAAKAFEETAAYDSLISGFLREKFFGQDFFPEKISFTFEKLQPLRYGENWHQQAALYKQPVVQEPGIVLAKQLNGKELSFNNINDSDAGIALAREFDSPTAVIIKHSNPCGVASDESISIAFKKAFDCDSKSAFGGVIVLNRQCDKATAEQIASFFNEIAIAPAFEESALDVLRKKQNLRVLSLPEMLQKDCASGFEVRTVAGGAVVQTQDCHKLNEKDCKVVSNRKPSESEMRDLLFAWKVAKHAKSNAIVLAKDNATAGIGAGQVSRIDSTELAIKKSGGKCRDSVLASDSFFSFRDNVDLAAEAGITAIIQPGGSIKDNKVIEAANEKNIALVFTGVRHFKH